MTNDNDLIPRGGAMKALGWGDIYGSNAQGVDVVGIHCQRTNAPSASPFPKARPK